MSTNKILAILGTFIVVLSIIIFVAISASPSYEETPQLQIHENAMTLRSAVTASATSNLLARHGSDGVSFNFGDNYTATLPQPSSTGKVAVGILLGGILGIIGAISIAVALYLWSRSTGIQLLAMPITEAAKADAQSANVQ